MAEHRKLFYEEISSVAIEQPDIELPRLCTIWKKHSGADWVWLWLYNDIANQWELVACASTDDPNDIPVSLTTPEKNCAAEYCNLTSKAVFIEDLENWRGQSEYKVVYAEHLKNKLHCKVLDCIPVISPPPAESHKKDQYSAPKIRGAICLHYRDPSTRLSQPSFAYELMGRLTAQVVQDSYEVEERRILFTLNALTEKYLTKVSKRPGELRRAYLEQLRHFIQKELKVKFVSIFWQNEMRDGVSCLDTSGLWEQGKNEFKKIPDDRIGEASYARNEGRTGVVFNNGEPFVSKIGDKQTSSGKYRELPLMEEATENPWIACPIPFFFGDVRKDPENSSTLGVIRCSSNTTTLFNRRRNFDSIQIKELSFITRQIAPILEAMAVYINREYVVSVVKHDLNEAIGMVRDTVTEMENKLSTKEPIPKYSLPDLGSTVLDMINLTSKLDPDPVEIPNIKPESTYLEGDIIARIQNMLRHRAKARGLKLHFADFAHKTPSLMIDRTLIGRALFNLVVNAIKYAEKDTGIEVVPLQTESGLYVNVMNYGIGIEGQETEKIFQGNFRSAHAQKTAMGLGLGLKIAKAIMEKHGGKVELKSPKNPTVFSLYFPRKLFC